MRSIVIIAALLSVACDDATDPGQRQNSSVPRLGEEFTLRVGEQVAIADADVEIRFLEVSNDSRCPVNALILCVWVGDAGVVIETSPQSADATHDTLHTTLDPKSVDLGSVTVTLRQLDPYPHDVTPIPTEEYVATLVATPTP